MKRLVRVDIAFGLMNKNDVYEADINDDKTSKMLQVGYLSLVETPEDLLLAQDESELESTAKVGAPAPRVKKQQSGKVSD